MNQQSPEKSTTEGLDAILGQLTTDQIRFVIARQNCASDKEAAEEIELKPNSVYKWDNKELVNEAVRLMALDGLVVARHIRRRNLAKAMATKVAGLDSKSEHTRQGVATEIIEWEMGKATQRLEATGKDGGPIVVVNWEDADDTD